jgi:hypothetical protein
MSEPTADDPKDTEDETPELAHDASPGGSINAPADEPDSSSPAEQKQGDAGRRRGTDDA